MGTTHKPPADALGLRITRLCREIGDYVSLYDGGPAGMDTEAGRWQTVCERDGGIISHETYALAAEHLSHPLQWCDHCIEAHRAELVTASNPTGAV